MSLVCALTGEVPEEAVFCPKTCLLYEKRLILKHILAGGCCPVSGLQIQQQDLIDVKTNPTIKPRPLSASSIPGLLSCLQTEWDALMSEAFSLKTHLEQVRKQLAHALYQQDAATRVIARLLKERDAAQQQLQQQQQLVLQLQRSAAAAADTVDREIGISEELMERMQVLARQLLSKRKKRQVSPFFDPPSKASSLKCSLSLPLHSAAARGVYRVVVDTNPTRLAAVFGSSSSSNGAEGEGGAAAAAGEEGSSSSAAAAAAAGQKRQKMGQVITVSSGEDGSVVFFNLTGQRQLCKVQAHAKACRSFLLHHREPVLVTGSDDKSCKIWRGALDFSESYSCVAALRKQRGEVTSLSLHPLGDYFAAVSADKSWAFIGIQEGQYLAVYRDLACRYTAVGFHPDGMILGAGGADGSVYIWDVKAGEQRAALQGHSGQVNAVSFSENGYYLATASADGTVRLWDLRKSAAFQTLQLHAEESGGSGVSATNACFDMSGLFVSACTSTGGVHLFHFEGRANAVPLHILEGHTDAVTHCTFVEGEDMLLTSSMDKTVKVWEPTPAN